MIAASFTPGGSLFGPPNVFLERFFRCLKTLETVTWVCFEHTKFFRTNSFLSNIGKERTKSCGDHF